MIENLTEQDILNVREQNFLICRTRFDDERGDKIARLRNHIIQDGYQVTIPDGFKIDRKTIIHIFDAHWYDSEMWIGESIRPSHITKLLDILENYDHIIIHDHQSSLRYLLSKEYEGLNYHIIVEVDANNPRVTNQLKLVTMYLNDIVGEQKYLQLKARNMIENERKRLKRKHWDRYLPDSEIIL